MQTALTIFALCAAFLLATILTFGAWAVGLAQMIQWVPQ